MVQKSLFYSFPLKSLQCWLRPCCVSVAKAKLPSRRTPTITVLSVEVSPGNKKKEHNSKFQSYFVTCIRYFWKKKYVVGIQTCHCHFSIITGKLKSLINVLFCTTSLQLQCLAGLEPACLLWLKVLSVNLNEQVFESQLYRHSQYKIWTFHKNGLSAHKPANFHFLFTS